MTRSTALEDIVPLSPLQQGLLYLSTVAAPTGSTSDDTAGADPDAYTVQSVVRLSGAVDEERMAASAQALLDRHPALRTCFRPRKDGRTAGLVVSGVENPWRSEDLSGLERAEAERRLEQIVEDDLHDWFDLTQPPLVRWTFVRFGADEVRLLAQRTAQSTAEIHTMIEHLQSQSDAAVKAIDTSSEASRQTVEQAREAGASLDAINQSLNNLTALNASIASATLQQSHVVEEINRNVLDTAGLSQQTADAARQSSDAGMALGQLSEELEQLLRQFRV